MLTARTQIPVAFLAGLLAVAALGSGCSEIKKGTGKLVRFRDDIKEVTFRVPALNSQQCRGVFIDLLGNMKGVVEAEADSEQNLIRVKFNSRETALKNIEYAISGSGFDVNETTGNAEARKKLPKECR